MTQKYPGGFVTLTPPTQDPALGAATPGIWTLDQALNAEVTRSWPMYDPYYKNVVLNLHGEGTNGAQNNTFLDSSTNNFTITRNGNTTQGSFSPYGSNWSNFFDGSSALQTPNNASLYLGSSNFTIECWVNLNYNAGGPNIIRTVNGYSFALIQGTTTLLLYLSSNGSSWDITSGSNVGSFTPNTWNHVAIVRNGSTFTCYVNGVAGATVTSASALYQTNGFYIGRETGGGYLNGYVSNARIVIGTAVYTSAFTPSTTPLTAITNTQLLTCQSNRFIDNSSNAFALTTSGSPSVQRFQPFLFNTSYTPSTIGGSGYFDGSGDYLTVATDAAFTFGTGDFTVEGWVYILAAGDDGFFQQGTSYFPSSTTNTVALGINNSGSTFQLYAKNTNTNSTITYALNSWIHFAVVRSGTTTTAYINGASAINVTSDSTNYTGTYFGIGALYGAGTAVINAYISNVRVVKGAAVYTGAFTPPTLPLKTSGSASAACYPSTTNVNTSFASSACSLLADMTNAGIVDNAMMNDLETVGNAQISTSVKKYGTGSMYFDGTGDYLSVPASPSFAFGTGDFTLECWLYVSSNPAQYTCIMSNWAGANPAWLLDFSNTSGNIRFNDNGAAYLTSSSALPTGQWNHVAVSRSGTSLQMFFNGTSVASATNSTSFGSATSGVFIGAYYNNTYPLNGYIDDLRITKGVARYVANFTPPTSQLQDQ